MSLVKNQSKLTQANKDFIFQAVKNNKTVAEIFRELKTLGFGCTQTSVYQFIYKNNLEVKKGWSTNFNHVKQKVYDYEKIASQILELKEEALKNNKLLFLANVAEKLNLSKSTIDRVIKEKSITLSDYKEVQKQRSLKKALQLKAERELREKINSEKKEKLYLSKEFTKESKKAFFKTLLMNNLKPFEVFVIDEIIEKLKPQYQEFFSTTSRVYINQILLDLEGAGFFIIIGETDNKNKVFKYVESLNKDTVFNTEEQQKENEINFNINKKSGFCNYMKKNSDFCLGYSPLSKVIETEIIKVNNRILESRVERFLCQSCLDSLKLKKVV